MLPKTIAALFSLASITAYAQEFSPEQIEFFETEIRPVLAENCYECHTGLTAKNGLRLNSRESILRGSDYRKIINLDKPAESILIHAVKHSSAAPNMPDKGEKLSDETIANLEKWVAMKLPWPEEKPVDGSIDPKQHWSFQPVVKPGIPADFKGNPIDFFVRKTLAEKGLESAEKADRYTRYRRLHFDLLGLPPKFEEAQKFINDPRPDSEAWPEMIRHLLGSQHYGERWARHWMDVARYSDTKGYEAGGRERRFVYSFTYRDWLIRAFNEDMPYNQFLKYQLAAEQLVDRDSPEKRHLAALGFITLSKNGRAELVIDDRLDTTFRGMMGLTVACARCHDHKFDPIPTKDYYSLAGVFFNSTEPKEKPVIGEPKSGPDYDKYLAELAKQQKVVDDFLEPKLKKIAEENPNIANRRAALIGKLERADRRQLQNLQRVVDKFVADKKMEPEKALIVEDRPKSVDVPVLIRGNPARRGEIAPRRFLSIIAGEDAPRFQTGSGRLEMANAIADPQNPLTARVIVNRIWMWHFGEGIVRTVSDFGTQGAKPSHPELLDFLATWFVENGWSIKKLHQLILESETWQQASSHKREAEFAEIDPENFLLWKMNRRRLDFEQMRDGILAAGNNLDNKMFGRTVKILQDGNYSNRRTVYAFIDRQNLDPTFRNFDFSNPAETTGKRPSTTIPMQTLFALNSGFVQAQGKNLAALAKDSEDKIGALHRAVFAAEPDSKHRTMAESFLTSYESDFSRRGKTQTVTEWSYGWGKIDPEKGEVEFKPFTHWTGDTWQITKEYPIKNDPRSYLRIGKNGAGHAGYDKNHALIYRWTAPRDLTVNLVGKLERPNTSKGDGVHGTILASGQGVILKRNLTPDRKAVDLNRAGVSVKKGDTIDFIVDSGPKGDSAFDSINWKPEIRNAAKPGERWNAAAQFSGPAEFATAIEAYAQALLISNRFQFVD
ncbi:MAG: DUF1553 domain-containing protein [Verrucomicrobiales bacterium]|nr:DUF1553 domain-containing protein [Verrucomicrobiales bacterium]